MADALLNPHVHNLLLTLEKFQGQGLIWVSGSDLAHIPHHSRQDAIQRGFIEARGTTHDREYKLLSEGLTALANNAEHVLNDMRGGDQPVEPVKRRGDKQCSVDGCDQPRLKPNSRCKRHHKEHLKAQQQSKSANVVVPRLGIKSFNPTAAPSASIVPVPAPAAIEIPPVENSESAYRLAFEVVCQIYPEVRDLVNSILRLQASRKDA